MDVVKSDLETERGKVHGGIEDIYPLTSMQRGMLFHTLFSPESGAYFEQLTCTLSGPLDVDAFLRCWQEVIDRHAILRTAIDWENVDEPLQVVLRGISLPIEELDWRDLSPDQRQPRLDTFLLEDRQRGFDLTQPPLMRLALIRLEHEVWCFVWSSHHLLFDGWSNAQLLEEFFALYESACRGEPLPSLSRRPYRDYIAWLQEQDLSQAEDFWRRTLAGFTAATPLGADRPGDGEGEDYLERQIELPERLTEDLQSLAQRHQVTLNTLLQGAWALLLGRYGNEDEVVFGVTVSGRPAALRGVESMVGLFINTLPLRVGVSAEQLLLPWLKSLQDQQSEMRQYEHSPLAEVQQWSDISSGCPLFESIFVFESYPSTLPEEGEASVEVGQVRSYARPNYPLSLVAAPGPRLTLRALFSTDRFAADAVERLLSHFQTLLEAIETDPERRLGEMPVLTVDEERRLLEEWHRHPAEYPRQSTIHEVFAQQVQKQPDAAALIFGTEVLTYGESDRRANRLACHLRRLGVGPEVVVALFMERSTESIIALLGLLKAGGAYLPLDPTSPGERLSYLLRDADAKIILTQQCLLHQLPSSGPPALCLDLARDSLSQEADTAVRSGAGPENLAYIIYTSGSTGRPKGTVVPHRAVLRLVRGTDYVRMAPEEVFLQLAPLSFDASTFEIWGSLLNGARLAVFPPEAPTLERLGREIEMQRVTTLWLTAPLFHLMVDQNLAALAQVRQLMAGGDVLSPFHVRKALAGGVERLVNGYGPTEGTTFTCCHPMVGFDQAFESIPIGRPIANTSVYVLDARLRPVPTGIPGELYIGLDGLARGYLKQPHVTAERFIAHPFADGERLYKSGDLVRWRSDGILEFLGRIDHQVKIRGFRVEPGEVEACLAEHPAVREAAVVVRRVEAGDNRLVAYISSSESSASLQKKLGGYLKDRLPEYMLPSNFVELAELPVTASGKLDRRALPEPSLEVIVEHVPPSSPAEEVLVGIWSDILRLESVGVRDDFFELGGHSLLATQAVSRIRRSFGVELALRALFDAPTPQTLARSIEQLRRSGRHSAPAPPIERVARQDDLPLSFGQQRLWFLDQLEPGSPVYNIPAAIRLQGLLDVSALEESLNEILRRHEALRTVFPARDGEPSQVILAEQRISLEPVDLSRSSAVDRERELALVVRQESERPFDLGHGPLLRVQLIRLGEKEHALMATMHHIVSDGWSMGILVDELTALYEAFVAGRPSSLSELPIQYADFSCWQRHWLRGKVLEQHLEYWKESLQDAEILEMPSDHPRPAQQSYQGAVETFHWPHELAVKVKDLSRGEDVTLYMTLMSVFQTLLYRYTGHDDVSVGTLIANRNRTETEGLIGFFVNTLVLRCDLSGQPTLRQLLGRVRDVTLDAYAHQDVPFEQVVETLKPERSLSRAPLFQVMFVLQNATLPERQLTSLKVVPMEGEFVASKFDLVLAISESEHGLDGSAEYSTDLFEASTIRRMLQHLRTLLESGVADCDEQISRLPLLTPAERWHLLSESNDTEKAYPRDSTLHQQFETLAARQPGAPALYFGEDSMSYGELNQRGNQLAQGLRSEGAGPESVVAILMERSMEMVVAMLGCLKAGAGYLPLDPAYPGERLSLLLDDSQVDIVLTQLDLLDRVPPGPEPICLDTDWERFAQGAEKNLDNAGGAGPTSLAQVIYTSGSTGRPKGVAMTHRAIVRLVKSTSFVRLSREDVVLQMAPISFDASTFEIWMPLLNGARLAIFPPERPSLHRIEETLRQHGVSFFSMTSALFHLQVDDNPDSLARVPQVLSGGDVLSVSHANRALHAGISRLINGYGPTENSTYSCSHVMEVPAEGVSSIPIGGPVANTRVYVLDRLLNPAPIGVPGELFVGGDGLARGYLDRPALTAERFVPHPFIRRGRLYKTGDLVRWRQGGKLEFLGRGDFQVKIRGFRIEPTEVESILSGYPGIGENVVIVREDEPGEKRLVAYFTSEDPQEASVLRDYLKELLPEYMVPSAFVQLDSLPLNPNGKLDRATLPAPEMAGPQSEGEYVEPRTPTEELVGGIWSDVLRLEKVGAFSDFFDLGGHSLLATQVISRVRKVFDVDLPLRALFEASVLTDLAQSIDRARLADQSLAAPPMHRVSRNQNLPLSFAQQRLWFLDQLAPGSSYYNVPTALRLQGVLDIRGLRLSLAEILRRHEALRTCFVAVDGKAVQVIADQWCLFLPIVDLSDCPSDLREQELERLAREEAQRSFDLSVGPLMRVTLVELEEEHHALLITMHHIVSDGWSTGVLVRELAALYQALSVNEPSPLPELALQYADFAAWQREWLSGAVLEEQLNYWKTSLAGVPDQVVLPYDRSRPEPSYRGGIHPFTMPSGLAQSLKQLGESQDVTLYMIMLAALQTLIHFYSGQERFCIGSPIANRNRSEIEGLIGYFVNTLVMRADLSASPTFLELLGRVREVALGAYAHQDIPFEKVVEVLRPERTLGREPFFQVMLTFQNSPGDAPSLPELSLSPIQIGHETAKRDLTLIMTQGKNRLAGVWIYAEDLFDASTIALAAQHFETLLKGIAATPDARVEDLQKLLRSAVQDRQKSKFEKLAAKRRPSGARQEKPRNPAGDGSTKTW